MSLEGRRGKQTSPGQQDTENFHPNSIQQWFRELLLMGFRVQTSSPKLKHKMVVEDIFDKMSFR